MSRVNFSWTLGPIRIKLFGFFIEPWGIRNDLELVWKCFSIEKIRNLEKNFTWDYSRGFGETTISGFQIWSGNRKVDVAPVQGELYTPSKFHVNRTKGLGGVNAWHLKYNPTKLIILNLEISMYYIHSFRSWDFKAKIIILIARKFLMPKSTKNVVKNWFEIWKKLGRRWCRFM